MKAVVVSIDLVPGYAVHENEGGREGGRGRRPLKVIKKAFSVQNNPVDKQ